MNDAMPPLALVPGLAERFWAKVDATGDCWEWTAHKNFQGYGRMYWLPDNRRPGGHRQSGAHRVAWEILVGPIPDGLDIDHRCYNLGCVNPDHLEPVTRRENLRRARRNIWSVRAALTHCPKGHPYDEANTYVQPSKNGRRCRVCIKEYNNALSGKRTAERALRRSLNVQDEKG